jgi:hypothetical protein
MSKQQKDQLDDDFISLDTLTSLGKIEDGDSLKLNLGGEKEEEEEEEDDDSKKPGSKPNSSDKPEDVEEEEEEEEEDDDSKKTLEKETKDSENFKTTLTTMFGKDAFDVLEVETEDGEIKEVSFKDADLDFETFIALSKSKIQEIEETAKKDKISIDSLSDFLKSMIEIEKNGGEVKKLADYREAYIEPLDKLDLDNVIDQKKAAIFGLRINGEDDDDIEIKIAGWEQKGILEQKARSFDANIRAAVDKKIAEEKNAVLAEKAKRDADLVVFRKDLKISLTQFELNDKATGRLVDLATKANEKGKFGVDELLEQKRKDPKAFAKILLMLADEEEFIKQVTREAVREKQIETSKRVRISLPSGGASVKSKSKKGEDDDFIELPKI